MLKASVVLGLLGILSPATGKAASIQLPSVSVRVSLDESGVLSADPDIQVIPGDIVAFSLPPAALQPRQISSYHCSWETEEEETCYVLLKCKVKKPHEQDVQKTGALGKEISLAVRVSGQNSGQFMNQPEVKLLAAEPGKVAVSGAVDLTAPPKPHPDATCNRTSLATGAWYDVDVGITRFGQ